MKKKLLTLLLAGCMALAVTACGAKETEEQQEAAAEDSTEETTTDTSVLGKSKLTKLGEYKGVEYETSEETVTDDQVESTIQSMLSEQSEEKAQEVVTESSYVNIDYVGKKDGVAFDGGTAQSQTLSITNSGYIDGFAESIVGMKVGETKDCPMTFPENYSVEELKGAEVVFTITVNECWEQIPAQLNDEFAVNNGYETVDALYEGVRARLQESLDQYIRLSEEYQVLQTVIDQSEFELDEDEIALYAENIKAQYEQEAYYSYGVDLETYVTVVGNITMEEFEKSCRENAIFTIQQPLVCDAVAEAEGLEVTDEIYQEKAAVYMENYGYSTVEALEEVYTKEMVMKQVLSDMSLDFMMDNAVAKVK